MRADGVRDVLNRSSHKGAYVASKPPRRLPHERNPQWSRFPNRFKGLLAIGRTSPTLPSPHTHEQIDEVGEALGFPGEFQAYYKQGWYSLSHSQQLDVMATWLIQESLNHENYLFAAKRAGVVTLSKHQLWTSHELPVADHVLPMLLVHHPDRIRKVA